MFHSRNGVYVLRVRGESMIEDHLCDGDYVVIERRETARNGEQVVALLDTRRSHAQAVLQGRRQNPPAARQQQHGTPHRRSRPLQSAGRRDRRAAELLRNGGCEKTGAARGPAPGFCNSLFTIHYSRFSFYTRLSPTAPFARWFAFWDRGFFAIATGTLSDPPGRAGGADPCRSSVPPKRPLSNANAKSCTRFSSTSRTAFAKPPPWGICRRMPSITSPRKRTAACSASSPS